MLRTFPVVDIQRRPLCQLSRLRVDNFVGCLDCASTTLSTASSSLSSTPPHHHVVDKIVVVNSVVGVAALQFLAQAPQGRTTASSAMGWLEERIMSDEAATGDFKLILKLGGPSTVRDADVLVDETIAILGAHMDSVEGLKASTDAPLTIVVYVAGHDYRSPAFVDVADALIEAYGVPADVGFSTLSDSPIVYRYV